jgi:membrane-associated phospholipid phosphatase
MTRPIEMAATRRRLPPWAEDLAYRIWNLLLLKTLGICAFMWLFFLGYFELLRNPVSPAVTMPLTPVDIWLPFQPGWLPVYLSLWFYVGIAPGIMLGLRELLAYGAWAGAMCGVGLGLFYLWPTAVPPLAIDVSGLPGFAMLQGVDAPGNACPSMHVAASMFSALWIERLLRVIGAPQLLRGANWVWLVAISYSTLAVRQHVFLDVVAGAALGAVFAWASMRWSPPVRVKGAPK